MSWPAPRRIYERDAFDLRRVHRALSPFSLIHDRSAPEGSRGGGGVCGEQTRDTAKLIVILVGRIINSQSASVSGWMLSRIRGSSPFSDLHHPPCGRPYVTTRVFSAVCTSVCVDISRFSKMIDNFDSRQFFNRRHDDFRFQMWREVQFFFPRSVDVDFFLGEFEDVWRIRSCWN